MGTVAKKHFDYGEREINYLRCADAALGAAMARLGRVERVIMPDPFAALVHAIVGQLVSVKAANTVWERMQERLGEISPRNLAAQPAERIQGCGMPMTKAERIQEIARLVANGEFDLQELRRLSDAEATTRLMTLPGVGKWTSEMLLIHALERPDVVSWGDIAIRRGMMALYGLDAMTKAQFDRYRRA
ncbi:DNA-3-methyladenine glycosylase 2 family protein [Paenibacillus melissococcoides]|uniref:DNA-3-methyladenine glycosylase II n=1 Tax=Paenibacillus melissococcoides TaxID=2912268 RepID=A0ABM9FYM3_9BACL|nr:MULTISPECIES: DNA-3-methyladenine glycosylase 2 family protein [Paenibacillus]MEB9896563.1 DNA-3-methyladenine glycosylase 2 family protein [Bacillus cereus]CAH8244317.1 DNA-3-methyladenine glycosylase 2 family protein [Paenibacillus melissococcoides]CAH8703449.1 DNA-3-methyladenine glycosylase 2 family protein [Paenibacillus melissococcoides]CAH8705864.1 DNA-3-methyladenine glycosylase 2 family protein [Paenibacillus melissococcoides]GIO77624.1 3-methyladenine DNA glycosylase [Paenibacillu